MEDSGSEQGARGRRELTGQMMNGGWRMENDEEQVLVVVC